MSNFVRRELPIIFTAIFSIILVAREFLPLAQINLWGGWITKSGTIITAFTAGLATIALLEAHIKHVMRKTPNQWIYSIILMCTLFLFIFAGLFEVSWYNTLYNTLVGRPFGANWGIMAFFLISGSYRSFRLRNIESYAISFTWLVVLLALTPLGGALFGKYISMVADYLILIVTTGSFRAFIVTAALGAIIFGLRVLLGLERGAFGGSGGG
jgi:hypothetical protein